MLTWIEIDTNAVHHNLKQFRKLIGHKTLLMPVIKANAYGHGILPIAEVCNQSREVDRLCIVSLDEAIVLLDNKISKPLIILAIYDLHDEQKIARAIAKKVVFPLYTIEQARVLNQTGERLRKKVRVHIKIDTGTSRIGILNGELTNFLKKIRTYKNIYIEGVFSHFSSSESDAAYTAQQWEQFTEAVTTFARLGFNPPVTHMACSAAIVKHPETHTGAVRLGIGLYGLNSWGKHTTHLSLRPALSWYTTIIQIKKVPSGTSVSYGRTFRTSRPTKIAVLPVGYYDGYDRRFSNAAFVLIKGKKCPIIGRVCMNVTMIDVTDVPGLKAGDRATLIGGTGQKLVTADELASIAGTINYEIVTRIGEHIPRTAV